MENQGSQSATRWISWHPSREDCFVLNVDGSCVGESGRAGAGGLIRKGDGSWVIGFSCFLEIADNNYAELMAVYHGLNLAMYNGCTDICCYSDSTTVIDLISKPINSLHSHASIIANIKELTNLDWKVKFSYTFREGNASADFLAKLGSSNDIKMKIWNSPPKGIETLLLSDSMRTLHPRLSTMENQGSPSPNSTNGLDGTRLTKHQTVTPSTASSSPVDAVENKQSVKNDDCGSEAKTKPFDICTPKQSGGAVTLKPSLFAKNREKRKETNQSGKEIVSLSSGMVHLKGYISITDQVKIVKVCRELGLGDGGFYQPGYEDGTKLHLKMMCLGKNWDPQTSKYVDQRPSDGSVPPKIPPEFLNLVHSALKDSQSVTKLSNSNELSSYSPDICIVNFYAKNGRLGLHQDKDESRVSLDAGLPVVSFSIGDSAEFLYGDERDVDKAKKVVLESGDVLIFGGKARNVFHGVSAIKPDTAPISLISETNLQKPGRLNLTFRQY